MIKVNEIKIPLDYENDLKIYIAKRLNIAIQDIINYTLLKWAVDARKKDTICFIANAAVELKNEENYMAKNKDAKITPYTAPTPQNLKWTSDKENNIIVVGSGPSGLFAALTLSKAGKKVTLIERGYPVEKRQQAIKNLETKGILDEKSNIQFGEGGAGTYSDGKLTTGIKSPYINEILATFVECGADPDIMYMSKPHIGSDVLAKVIVNIRKQLINLGTEVLFEHKLTKINVENNAIKSIEVETDNGIKTMPCDTLILALGHSARDTIYSLYESGIKFEQKPFSMGVRIEHLQEDINKSQYGKHYKHKNLKPADYKLFTHLPSGRCVYTFCMCPGGYVVPSTSIEGHTVTNGMSLRDRAGINANSALLVNINPEDFGSNHPLAGLDLQEKYEKLAYSRTGSYKAVVQKVEDLHKDTPTTHFGKVKPSYLPGVEMGEIMGILPDYVIESIKEALPIMDKELNGFNDKDALLTGIESRTSAPYRMVRDDTLMANIGGIYPIGEGAGFAGGIISSAVDGIKVAIALINKNNE